MKRQLELGFAPEKELRAEMPIRLSPRKVSPWDRISLGVDTSPQWVVSALDKGERGDMHDLVLLVRRMEERLPGFSGALGQLKYALTEAEVRIKPASKEQVDIDIADAVRRALDSDGFQLQKPDMLDNLGIGYSVLEQRWGDQGSFFVPMAWQHVRPDIIMWNADGFTPELDLGYGSRAKFGHGRWVTHISRVRSGLPVNCGLGRSVAMFYLFYSRAWLSLMAFADIFGLPVRVGKYDENTSSEDIAVLRDAMHSIGSEAVALIKKNMDFEIIRANASGNAGSDRFWADYIALIEDQVIKAVLGQTMTSQNGGGSLAKAEVAERGKDAQVRALAFQLSACWRRDIIRPIVDLNLGMGREAPEVWLDVEDGEDISKLAEGLVKLVDRGLPVLAGDILDRCGLPIPPSMPEDLELHPLNGAETSAAMKDLKTKSEKASRLLLRVCESINSQQRLREVIRDIGPELAEAGFELKHAA